MIDPDSQLQPAPVAAEEFGLKNLSEEQLFENLLEAGHEWTDDERKMVEGAYSLAGTVHAGDMHKDKPYTYHLLRNANRVVSYLHITDPEIIAAVLLHDTVEDHPDDIMKVSFFGTDDAPGGLPVPEDPVAKQQLALRHLSVLFSPRVAKVVSGMTNPPAPLHELPYDEWLQQYADHVKEAIEDKDVWVGKIVDWGDNGLGIVHSELEADSPQVTHFARKYGLIAPILEARYRREDIQEMLSPAAKVNVEKMFTLARERLITPETKKLGTISLAEEQASSSEHTA